MPSGTLSSVCIIFAGLLFSGPRLLAQTVPSQYVGSEACQTCHEDVASNIAASAHAKLAQPAEPERRGCEACHGPGSNHVNSGGDKTLVFSFKDASVAAIRRQCGICHESVSDSVHTHRGTSCLSCHAAHHYRQNKYLLVEVPPQLCTDCHDRTSAPARN